MCHLSCIIVIDLECFSLEMGSFSTAARAFVHRECLFGSQTFSFPFLSFSCLPLCSMSLLFSIFRLLCAPTKVHIRNGRAKERERDTPSDIDRTCMHSGSSNGAQLDIIDICIFLYYLFFFSIFYLLYILLHTFASWFYFNLNLLFFLLFENVRNFLSSTLSIVFVSVSVSLSYTCSSQYSIKIHLRISNGIYLIVMDVKMCITCSRCMFVLCRIGMGHGRKTSTTTKTNHIKGTEFTDKSSIMTV